MTPHPNDLESLITYEPFVRRLSHELIGDEHAAEDVVQQTWLAALQCPPRRLASSREWLAQVVRNSARRWHRSKVRRTRRETVAARPDRVPSVFDQVQRESAKRLLLTVLEELHEPVRSAVILRHLENLPLREVAMRMSLPTETVRSQIRRGLAVLRSRLDREFGGNRGAWISALAPLATRPRGTAPALSVKGSAPGERVGENVWRQLLRPSVAGGVAIVAMLGFLWWFNGVPAGPELEGPFDVGGLVRRGEPVRQPRAELAVVAAPPSPAVLEPVDGGDEFDEKALGESSLPRYRVAGTVNVGDSGPAPGATVYFGDPDRVLAFNSPSEFGGRWSALTDGGRRVRGDGWTSVLTDEDGRYEIPLETKVQNWALAALHFDWGVCFRPNVSAVVVDREVSRRLVLVARVIRLAGTVLDEQGIPIRGAKVDYWPVFVSSLDGRGITYLHFRVHTGADGGFKLPPMPFDTFRITISASGFVPLELDGRELLERGGEMPEVQLQRAERIVGRVVVEGRRLAELERELHQINQTLTEGLDVLPLRAAIVDRLPLEPIPAEEANPGCDAAVRIDRETYRITPERPLSSASRVVLIAGGFLLGSAAIQPGAEPPDLRVDPSRLARLMNLGRVRIHVRDSLGAPVKAFRVGIAVSDRRLDLRLLSSTDVVSPDGHWDLTGLPPGRYFLEVHPRGCARSVASVQVRNEPDFETNLEIEAGSTPCRLRVRLSDEEGRPYRRARVILLGSDGTSPAFVGRWTQQRTCADNRRGAFSFQDLASGRYLVKVFPLATAHRPIDFVPFSRWVDVAEDDAVIQLTSGAARVARLVPVPAGRDRYAFRILDDTGFVVQDDRARRQWRFGREFAFQLGEGDYTVELESPGCPLARAHFSVPTDGVIEIPLRR